MRSTRCTVCGVVRYRDPYGKCPVCGAPRFNPEELLRGRIALAFIVMHAMMGVATALFGLMFGYKAMVMFVVVAAFYVEMHTGGKHGR